MLISVWVFSPCPMAKLSTVAGDPAARAVEPVEVGLVRRKDRLLLARQVDAAAVAEAHEHAILDDGIQPEPQAQLVEVHVAALGDGADQ